MVYKKIIYTSLILGIFFLLKNKKKKKIKLLR